MPDTTTEPATEPADQSQDQTSEQPPAEQPNKPLGEGGERALASERDARKSAEKELAKLRKQIEEHEAAKLSDIERATKAAETEKQRAEGLAAQLARYQVIADTGLPKELHEFLPESADVDALTEKAGKLMSAFKAASAPGTPRPDSSQGAKGEPVGLDARITEAESKGDFKTAIALKAQRLTNPNK